MDIILTLIRQLSASLSPTEFLMVLGIITVTTVFLVRFFLKNKAAIVAWATGQKEVDLTQKALEDIHNQMKLILSSESFHRELTCLHAEMGEHANDIETLKLKFEELINLCERVLSEAVEMKHNAQQNSTTTHEQYMSLLSQIQKSQDTIQRTLSEIEKVDELAKAAIPEFRGYHRDLSNELNALNKDIALIERSIQLQINTGSGVKLR